MNKRNVEEEILLVEDNPYEVELIKRALKKGSVANPVRLLGDGVEALDFFFGPKGLHNQTDPAYPRVIILDLKLPRVDGLEVLRRLKQDDHTHSIPVVVLTSSAEERDIQECYRLGANSYIVKPVDFDLFLEMIANLGRYWLDYNRSLR